ncbi:RluA family pseudouridine synthase [Poriferisphaera sp. WC338]|uniref:RluA family pseudouridine synthase n=1 Tax=Poriferisphaera sp. WC338 TaxID=3425129 RepID=UPI003D81C22E
MSKAIYSQSDGPFDDELFEEMPDELEGGERLRYVLSKNSALRVDKYLQNRLKGMSRHQIQKLIALEGVLVNEKVVKPSTKLKAGDILDVMVPPKPTAELNPEPIPLEILYEDDGFIVVNKQANLIVHPARGRLSGTLINGLAYHFQNNDTFRNDGTAGSTGLSRVGEEDARPGVIHRLDKNTTGVIVVGKQEEPHWLIAKQFENRTNLKVYLAVVHGCPEPEGGVINEPIGKHPTYREAMAVRHDSTSKESVTIYRVRERYQGYSLVELELKSGRTHQIRVHMQYIGHPLVGDIIYGGEPVGIPELDNPPLPAGGRANLTYARDKNEGIALENAATSRDDMIMHTPALHAAMLGLQHPINKQDMLFTAPVHAPLHRLIRELRKRPGPGPVVTSGTHLDLSQAIPDTDDDITTH